MNWALANNYPPQRTIDRTHVSFTSNIQGFARSKKNRTWYELEFSMSPNKCRLGRTYIWTFNQFKINTACCEPINLTTVTSSSLLLCFKSCFRLIDLWTYQYLLQLFIRDFNLVSRSWHINYFTINGNVSNLQREIPCLPSAYNLRFPYRIHPVGKSTLYSWSVSCMCS